MGFCAIKPKLTNQPTENEINDKRANVKDI